MNLTLADAVWLDDQGHCSLEYLLEVSGLSTQEMADLLDAGIIAPVSPDVEPPVFQLRYVVTASTARHLREDFELDQNGLMLALSLMRRIDQLEQQLANARARVEH